MVRIEQVKDGFETFCINEMQPQLSSTKGFLFGTVMGVILAKFDNVVNWIKTQPLVSQLGIIDNTNHVDDETLFNVMKKQAEKNNVVIDFPIIGTVTFARSDVEKLHNYIKDSRA